MHTPAPWHVNAIDSKTNRIVGDETSEGWDKLHINGGNCTVARVYRTHDARLIAGAPELKGELVELCFKADTAISYLRAAADGLLKSNRGYLDGFIAEMERRTASARAAIARAEGKNP